jgi:hypothetical protein
MGLMTGIAIAGLVTSVTGQVVAAKKAGNAAKDVAKMQTAAADRGRADITAAKNKTDALYQPYVTAGRTAATSLGRLVTPGPGAKFAAADPTQPKPSPPPAPMPGGRPRPPGAPPGGPAVPRGYGPESATPQGGGGMVMLEANDGSGARPVPASQAQRILSTGKFRRVG